MGTFLQYALFPGCDVTSASAAVGAARKAGFAIDPDKCRYAQSYEGTQVLIEGDELGFAPLAKALSDSAVNPVMLLYIYDGDFWGYDFYSGHEEAHFSTLPDYFEPVTQEEKARLSGNPAALMGWFPIQNIHAVKCYLVHWSDMDEEELDGEQFALVGDQFPYGDCWQMTDFAACLGFPWPFDQAEGAPPMKPPLPKLGEILAQNLPRMPREESLLDVSLLRDLPSALSAEYIQRLLDEDGVREFRFETKTPRDVMDGVNAHRWTLSRPERDPLCQRLAVLAAFCAYWLNEGSAWGFLDRATYEPLYGSAEKPTDIYVLRARAALTDFTKRHRAWKDLERLTELDPTNRALYQAEARRWVRQEKEWQERTEPRRQNLFQDYEETKRQEAEREAKRLQLILEKRRRRGKH
ncbi:MAG: hypothetical protein K2M15_02995 [Oscillospiraceae bacterium]|nr:hypothetical protein [Oscillospiraceae bacterium]